MNISILHQSFEDAKSQVKSSIKLLYCELVNLLKENGGYLNLSDFMGMGGSGYLNRPVWAHAWMDSTEYAAVHVMGIRLRADVIEIATISGTAKVTQPWPDDKICALGWKPLIGFPPCEDFLFFQSLMEISDAIVQHLRSVVTDKGLVRPGTKIRIRHLNNGDSPIDDSEYDGKEGVVEMIDSMDGFHGTWGGLAVYSTDEFEIIG